MMFAGSAVSGWNHLATASTAYGRSRGPQGRAEQVERAEGNSGMHYRTIAIPHIYRIETLRWTLMEWTSSSLFEWDHVRCIAASTLPGSRLFHLPVANSYLDKLEFTSTTKRIHTPHHTHTGCGTGERAEIIQLDFESTMGIVHGWKGELRLMQ